MKKIFIIFMFVVGIIIIPNLSQAKTWADPSDPNESYMAGECIMVNTRVEADSLHVYTLNPDYTRQLNYKYLAHWARNARCDELQFHVDHNTTLTRLNDWLYNIAKSWYSNIGASHFNHRTISTSRHEWYYVDNNGIHRIYDWPTALSFGLIVDDRLSIPAHHTSDFYKLVTIGEPLKFSEGQYATKIDAIWHEDDREYSSLPSAMVEELDFYIYPNGFKDIFKACGLEECRSRIASHTSLLDWSWIETNTGCQ